MPHFSVFPKDQCQLDGWLLNLFAMASLLMQRMSGENLLTGSCKGGPLNESARSYGIVLWEIVTFGSLPYPGLSNEEVVATVGNGNSMDLNDLKNCPDLL